ncbi:MAG: hypothetical protein M1820_008964 [Bogoriella megaspora]|nr:MAG: hypothetical protein M1820_008964 [Bogoriella megaspora]
MSPRRSSRTIQPPPSALSHSNSTSSVSSARAERSTRSLNKQTSTQKSATPQSLSSEDVGDPALAPEVPQTRRSKRGHTNDEEEAAKLEDEPEDDIEEEEEVTRCVCGHQDYPGPPPEYAKTHSAASSIGSDAQNDDVGSLFIQCDICKVWQHGGCVGIMDEDMSPDEYFCEECKREFHKLVTGPKGQKYSRYLPVLEQAKTARKNSLAKDLDRASSNNDKKSKATADVATKRRSTMNSRGTEQDEAILQMVLEQSSRENAVRSNNGARKAKRARDDSSDEPKHESKRQRTGSVTPEPASHTNTASLTADSDDEGLSAKALANKKGRSAVAKNQREKDLKERDKERERDRVEAANKRKERAAGRRRAEGMLCLSLEELRLVANVVQLSVSESPDEPLAESSSKLIGEKNPKAEAPNASDNMFPATSNHQKKAGGRPAKRGRLGRNQYTRDRDPPAGSDSRASPRHRPNGDRDTVGNGNTNDGEANHGARGRTKEPTLNEIKKRILVMQGYMARVDAILAGDENPPSHGDSSITSISTLVSGFVPTSTNPEIGTWDYERAEYKKGYEANKVKLERAIADAMSFLAVEEEKEKKVKV